MISTVAGNHYPGYRGDGGPATAARLDIPTGVAVDSAGDIYIADTSNNAVREVASDGYISTVAGNRVSGYYGDGGPASAAGLNAPADLATDSSGDLFVADTSNSIIREVTAKTAPPIDLAVASPAGTPSYGDAVTFTVTVEGTDPDSDVPTGTVALFDGGTCLGYAALDGSGNATIATSALPAGGDEVTARYSGDANYVSEVSSAVAATVAQAVPEITWAAPAAIGYGTALSTAQLDATAGTAGTFSYSPATGTVLPAGTTPLTVTFTPTDTADYTAATATVNLAVTPANLTVSGLAAEDKFYDGTTTAALDFTAASLGGVLAADNGNVSLDSGNYSATFASAGPGTGIAVTVASLGLSGTAAGNYVVSPLPSGLVANVIGPPAAPTGLTAAAFSSSEIDLSWTAPAGPVTGYNVYRGASPGGENYSAPINGVTPVTTTSYSDTGVAGGDEYYYTVEAVNAAGSGSMSAECAVSGKVDPGMFLGVHIIVTSTSGGAGSPGNVTLAYAVTCVDNHPGTYTINFAPSVFGRAQTIDLSSVLRLTGGNVTIAGPGAGLLTLNCGNSGSAFAVASGATLNVSGLRIVDATSSGIVNNGALRVASCTFVDDRGYYGGGIGRGGTLTVTAGTFSGNASDGVGDIIILNGASLSVTSSTFSGNSAYEGGGIYWNGAGLSVTLSTFSDNSAYEGGGIAADGRTCTVASSTFSFNSAVYCGHDILNNRGKTLTVVGALSGDVTDDGTLTFSISDAQTYSGDISGTGSVTVAGGTLTFTGDNTCTGGTTVAAGATLEIDSEGSITGDVTDNGQLVFAQNGPSAIGFAGNISGSGSVVGQSSSPLTLSGVISGSIQVVQHGPGAMTLSGVNSCTGGTVVQTGQVEFFSSESVPSGGGFDHRRQRHGGGPGLPHRSSVSFRDRPSLGGKRLHSGDGRQQHRRP